MVLAAIRIRSAIEAPQSVKDTLYMLKLRQKFACCLYKHSPSILGMLEKAKAYIAYGEIDDDTLRELILKRGRKPGDKKLNDQEAEEVFKKIKEGKFDEAYKIIKPFFRLSPPKGGFKKTIKLMWPQGVLGNVGDEINKMIKRML